MTKKQISKLRKICDEYGVKLKLIRMNDDYGFYRHSEKTVFLNKKLRWQTNWVYSILFHELGHKYCFDNNKFYAYHHDKNKRCFLMTALKAERFVDKWAAKELKRRRYKFKYLYFYSVKTRANKFRRLMKEFANKNIK